MTCNRRTNQKFVLFCIACALFFSRVQSAKAGDFTTAISSQWERIEYRDRVLFHNSRSKQNETVTVSSFPISDADITEHENLERNLSEINSMRKLVFSRLLFRDYDVLNIEKRRTFIRSFKFVQQIHARYTGIAGQNTHVLERQFVKGHRMYVVTYSVEALALNDVSRANQILDLIQPKPRMEREIASVAAETTGSAGANGREKNFEMPGSEQKPDDLLKGQQKCEHDEEKSTVPELQKFLMGNPVTSCVLGGFEGMKALFWDLPGLVVGGVLKGVKATGSAALDPVGTVKKAGVGLSQGMAAVGTAAAEFFSHPIELAKALQKKAFEVVAQAYASTGHWIGCLRFVDITRIVCALLVPPVAIFKLLFKIPLGAEEGARFYDKLSALMRSTTSDFSNRISGLWGREANATAAAESAAKASLAKRLGTSEKAVENLVKESGLAPKEIEAIQTAFGTELRAGGASVERDPNVLRLIKEARDIGKTDREITTVIQDWRKEMGQCQAR